MQLFYTEISGNTVVWATACPCHPNIWSEPRLYHTVYCYVPLWFLALATTHRRNYGTNLHPSVRPSICLSHMNGYKFVSTTKPKLLTEWKQYCTNRLSNGCRCTAELWFWPWHLTDLSQSHRQLSFFLFLQNQITLCVAHPCLEIRTTLRNFQKFCLIREYIARILN